MMQLKAAIFDWAGTMIDFGSRAPMGAFVDVFAQFGVEITVEEARGPMGLPKLDHIRALGRLPRVEDAWTEAQGTPFDEEAAGQIYELFVPLNAKVVTDYADLIPGAADVAAALRAKGMKIGSTTGYTREIMKPLLPVAAAQGYAPDNLVCSGDLPAGRPTPLGMYKCFVDLGVWPAAACVKVDDTAPGIAEGRAAGCWTVAVSLSSNEVGLSAEELANADPAEIAALNQKAAAKLAATGADYVINTVADLPPIIDKINARLEAGERPAVIDPE